MDENSRELLKEKLERIQRLEQEIALYQGKEEAEPIQYNIDKIKGEIKELVEPFVESILERIARLEKERKLYIGTPDEEPIVYNIEKLRNQLMDIGIDLEEYGFVLGKDIKDTVNKKRQQNMTREAGKTDDQKTTQIDLKDPDDKKTTQIDLKDPDDKKTTQIDLKDPSDDKKYSGNEEQDRSDSDTSGQEKKEEKPDISDYDKIMSQIRNLEALLDDAESPEEIQSLLDEIAALKDQLKKLEEKNTQNKTKNSGQNSHNHQQDKKTNEKDKPNKDTNTKDQNSGFKNSSPKSDRDKILEEIKHLESLLDDELDPEDMVDQNRQAILNRIAELKDMLQKFDEKDKSNKDTGTKEQNTGTKDSNPKSERDKISEEIKHLESLLDDELDPEDMPDQNRQAILNRIAELKDKLKQLDDKDKQETQEATNEKGKEETALKKTGLQIFRQEFNQMPEIKRKHTVSENPLLPVPGSLAVGAATAGFVLTGPIGWAVATGAAVVSYFAAKPLLRKVTGQSKIEKEITQQFNDMDAQDLKLMADFLTEETITDLKPNAVILRSLNKSLRTLANRENQKLEKEIEVATQERDKLLAKTVANKNYVYTDPERERLGELKDIIDRSRKEAEDNELRSKNAKRGKDRVSAMYKGNVGDNKLLNIFHKRNSTTKEYKPALVELADAELDKIKAEHINDTRSAAEAQAAMERVGSKYTRTNSLGISRGPFNMRKAPARIMSDQRDNTVRNIGVFALAGASLYRTVTNMNEMANELKNAQNSNEDIDKVNQFAEQFNQKKSNLDQSMGRVSDADIQGTGNTIVSDTFSRGEVAAMRGNGGTVSHMNEGYVLDDQLTQELGNASAENAKGILNGGLSDKLRNLSKLVSGNENVTITQKLQDAVSDAHSVSGAGIDHAAQFGLHENAVQYNQNHSDLYEHLADVTDKAEEIMQLQAPTLMQKVAKIIKPDFLGPIAAAFTSVGSTLGIGIKRNQEQKVDLDVGKEEER